MRSLHALAVLPLLLSVTTAAPQGSAPTLAAARQKIDAQDWSGAAAILEELVAANDRNGNAWFLLGLAKSKGGDWEEGLDAYRIAAEFGQLAPSAHYNAARLCARNGLVEDALLHVELALEAGFEGRGLLLNDPDLASLQADERFQALVPPLKPSTELFTERPRVLHTFYGEAPGDVFGWIGRDAGDADGDGRSDLLISAPYSQEGGPGAGKIYVYSGATGELLFQRVGKPGEGLGIGIETAGDVNGDGHADSLAGAYNQGQGPGVAYVYSGKDGATLLTLTTGEKGDLLGRKVSGGVDFDGDGRSDLLVGAPGAGPDGRGAGKAHVFSGRTGEVLATIEGERGGDAFGAGNAVWSDGETKLLAVGAANAGDGNRGRVVVYRWEEGGPEPAFAIESDPDGSALGGMFVSFPGDMDGDGISEVYASDWQAANSTGRIYVHSGASGDRLFVLSGKIAGEGFGTCTADVGDVDGDGRADLLVGAWQNPTAARGGGKCTLYACGPEGARRVLATYTCNAPGETLGFDTTGVGDLDGDGGTDFLVTGGYSTVSGQRSGRAFVIAGPVPVAAGD
jgi:hypothetical protein